MILFILSGFGFKGNTIVLCRLLPTVKKKKSLWKTKGEADKIAFLLSHVASQAIIQKEMAEQVQYTEDNIRSLEWNEHIRLRPGMYIGKLGDGFYGR